jgi:beta-glucanase (GH16 family)
MEMKTLRMIAWSLVGLNLFTMAEALRGQGSDPVLVWSDEFEVDGLPDATKWLYDVGGDGWGNNEEQYYTEGRLENARVESGILIIEARKEGWPPSRNPPNDYTSARLVSKGRGDWLYGKIEVKAKMPAGVGTWPAIWMLSTGNTYGTWPRSGEIDIMEHVGFEMGTVHGSLHSLANNWTTGTQPTGSTTVPDVDTAFHVYAVEWSPAGISFLIDDVVFYSADNPGTGWEAWPFDQPFHLILNLAVGGFWGGQQGIDPDIWPARMEVDYVRVYDLGDMVPLDTDNDQDPNSTDPDDDGDGLSDVEEHGLGTNLLNTDTDGDTYSDFDEVEAGTNPLLASSFPGADEGVLIFNADFIDGEDPWIIHTNKLDAEGAYISQSGSWGGAYGIFDYVTVGDPEHVFTNYVAGDTPKAEHLLYQEWNPATVDLVSGDVIRFRGVARSAASSGDFLIRAFVKVLDSAFQALPASAFLELTGEDQSFELVATLPEGPFNVVQAGFSIEGFQTDTATVTFSGLEGTLNEEASWGGWPVVDGNVDTEGWIGWLYIDNDPWVWSYSLNKWIYLPEVLVTTGGGWVYIPN